MTALSRLRIGVIVDRQMLARWQVEALRTVTDEADLLVYSCRNSRPDARRSKFAFYYLLNLFTIRNRMTRRRAWPVDLPAVVVREFDAPRDGVWQSLPAELVEQFGADRVDVILKFGMGLLRVPTPQQLSVPILSYHHGDPAEFRGRPAGFYEMLAGGTVMGQVVQRISNDLDAGEILASAETKIFSHSYHSTLIEAYRHSPLILQRAIENVLAGGGSSLEKWGSNNRLPTNGLVLKFLLAQWSAAAKRLLYGLFIEKRWQVATAALPEALTINSLERAISDPSEWRIISIPSGFRFLADPFFHPAGGLMVEGMNSSSCRGEILHVGEHGFRQLSGIGGHYSYPAHLNVGDNSHIIPETSDWSPAQAFPLGDDGLGEPSELKIPGRPALLDPTPYWEDGILYLFANKVDEGASVLRLWTAKELHGEFSEHPSSPIRFSPRGSRMAGSLLSFGGQLYRIGQDLRGRYGDGLVFFRINRIDPSDYSEAEVHDFRFGHVRGPHTLNLSRDQAAFDYYVERFAALAGIRRLLERRAAQRVR